ncbi:vWA domain-containing protein [Rhodococcus aetherivorans]|uniref:vWA domain-containing protein n=1 Tax=Rhodococcus aetherivorans TaxID=191292 RepID=UPI0011C4802D|nr:vWA domain-containing protein [Rhodococcus aetherivorans]
MAIRTSPIVPPKRETQAAKAAYVIVLDASESMGWPAEPTTSTSRWVLALQAIQHLLTLLPSDDEIHVVKFNSQAQVLVQNMTVAELKDSVHLIEEPAPKYGRTNVEAGLTKAYDMLRRSSAISRRAILISDGQPNEGATSQPALAMLAKDAAKQDLYTDTIGMGADADIDLLLAVSANGGCGHVESSQNSHDVLSEIVSKLARQGQDLAASGGELNIQVHPQFPIGNIYMVNPSKRRLDLKWGKTPDGGQTVSIPLGAVGTGAQQPLFALRLTAPDKVVNKKLKIVQVSGTLRTATGSIHLDTVGAMVSGIAERPVINLEQLMISVRSIEFESETARRLKDAPRSSHAAVYREARRQALDAGLDDLAADYQSALQGLDAGLEANDVRNKQRSVSSTSHTTPNQLLQGRPVLDPDLTKRDPQRRIHDTTAYDGTRPMRGPVTLRYETNEEWQ